MKKEKTPATTQANGLGETLGKRERFGTAKERGQATLPDPELTVVESQSLLERLSRRD